MRDRIPIHVTQGIFGLGSKFLLLVVRESKLFMCQARPIRTLHFWEDIADPADEPIRSVPLSLFGKMALIPLMSQSGAFLGQNWRDENPMTKVSFERCEKRYLCPVD